MHGGQRGVEILRQGNVVKTDDRQRLRQLNVPLVAGAHHAGGHHVVEGHCGSEAWVAGQHALGRQFAPRSLKGTLMIQLPGTSMPAAAMALR